MEMWNVKMIITIAFRRLRRITAHALRVSEQIRTLPKRPIIRIISGYKYDRESYPLAH